jgi:hypothetical protein
MTDTAPLTPRQRVLMFVGGNFSRAALGPRYQQVLDAIDADPRAHLAAFDQLFLAHPATRLDRRKPAKSRAGCWRAWHRWRARRLVRWRRPPTRVRRARSTGSNANSSRGATCSPASLARPEEQER